MVSLVPALLRSAASALAQIAPIPAPIPGSVPVPVPAGGSSGTTGSGVDTDMNGGDALPRDRSRERERSCKCPPENGEKVERHYSMNPAPRRYQARITGYEYGITTDGKGRETRDGWNMEWAWLGSDFDGFVKAQCLLQEAKADYDQFLEKNDDPDEDDKPVPYFNGFNKMADTIKEQGAKVRSNPPSRLMWYFGTPRAREYMLPTLRAAGVPSVYQP